MRRVAFEARFFAALRMTFISVGCHITTKTVMLNEVKHLDRILFYLSRSAR